jgi:uncharacterized membrane protein
MAAMIAPIALTLLSLHLLGAAPPESSSAGWQQVTVVDGVTVYARPHPDSDVKEVRAVAVLDAPPEAVWRVVRDYPNQPRTLPYVEAARVLASEEGGKRILLYNVINAPLVDKRDCVVRITDESQWDEGRGYLLARWTASEGGPPPVKGIVRVRVNDGSWLLEPRDGGRRTQVTYSLYTDPGGSLPRWVVNRANRSSLPEVLHSLRRAVAAQQAQKKP